MERFSRESCDFWVYEFYQILVEPEWIVVQRDLNRVNNINLALSSLTRLYIRLQVTVSANSEKPVSWAKHTRNQENIEILEILPLVRLCLPHFEEESKTKPSTTSSKFKSICEKWYMIYRHNSSILFLKTSRVNIEWWIVSIVMVEDFLREDHCNWFQ